MATAISDGDGGDPHEGHRQVEGDREDGAERRARGHAQRERRRQRVPQQPLEDHPRRGEERAHARAREGARQPRDEEDLRIHVVGKRDRKVEHPPEVDRRRTGERRHEQRDRRQRAKAEDGADEARLQRHPRSRSTVRRSGTTIR
jgi:hypothetical protein